jgi:hypothetical protein
MRTRLFDLKIHIITGGTMEQCITYRECHSGDRDSWYQKQRYRELETVKTRKHGVREEAQEYAHNYLSTHPCTVCGESDPAVLEFHHIRGKGWILNSILGGNSLVALQAEISKCIVLCANCHRKISNDEPGWLKSTK